MLDESFGINDFHIYFIFSLVIFSSQCDIVLYAMFVPRCFSFLFRSGICSV